MEIVKKIITWILILCGIAFAGVIICGGIMIASPSTQIFGYSYLNTNSDTYEPIGFDDITTDTINIYVETKDFDVVIKQGSRNVITVNNKVFGFTKEQGANKYATVEDNISTNTGNIELIVNEPSGIFLTRKTSITIELSANTLFSDKNKTIPRTINLITKTQNGKTTFGSDEAVLNVNNLTCSCTGGRGSVDMKNVKIANNLKIENILGKVDVNYDINGEAIIQSTVGSYTFKKINKLTVISASATTISAPSITVDEVGELNYTAQSGNLKINKYLLKDSYIETKEASISIDTVVKKLTYICEGNAKITINKLGNFNPSVDYSSWNWKTTQSNSSIDGYFESNGTIEIGTNYLPIRLEMQRGKAIVKKALNTISAITNKANLDITFYNDGNFSTSTGNDQLNQVNTFINENLISKLSNSTNYLLNIESTTGKINVSDIICPINIVSENSPITLNFIKVHGTNNVKTSSKAVKVNAQIDNFILVVKAKQNSKAKIDIEFGAIELKSFDANLLTEGNKGRVTNLTDDNYKGYKINVADAKPSCTDILTITNDTGNIIATGYII